MFASVIVELNLFWTRVVKWRVQERWRLHRFEYKTWENWEWKVDRFWDNGGCL